MPSISKNRKFLMGLAIILILFCHNSIVFGRFQDTWVILKRLAQFGVDIFLLLSGFGLYFSYSKTKNYFTFIKKRLSVILPPYCLVVIPYIALLCLLGRATLKQALWNYSLISFFTDGTLTEWYIAAILVLYLLFPVFYRLSKNNVVCILTCLALWIAAIVLNLTMASYALRVVSECFIVRIPVFLLGIKLAWLEEEGRTRLFSPKWQAIVLFLSILAAVLLSLMWNWRYWIYMRILFCPMSISACCVIAFLRDKWHRKDRGWYGKIDDFICYLGGMTLWLYLLHEKILQFYNLIFLLLLPYTFIGTVLANLFAVLLAITLGAIFSKALKLIGTKRT